MGISFLDSCYRKLRKVCGNDDTYVLLVLLALGFVLCKVFNLDGFSGSPVNDNDSGLTRSVEVGEKVFGFGKEAPHTEASLVKDETSAGLFSQGATVQNIGLTPKDTRQAPPAASLKADLQVLGPTTIPNFGGPSQKGGVLAQDGTIARPFSEVWNPGFAPVDYEFKGAVPLDNTKPVKDALGSAGADYGASTGKAVNLTLYYAPWCPHCKNMMGDFDKFQSEHHGKIIGGNLLNVFKVNSDEEPDKVKEAGVNGFPAVKIDGTEHKGFPRDYEGMKSYMEKMFSAGVPGQTAGQGGGPVGVLNEMPGGAPVDYTGTI
jgi:thiol-disulfide isomerase/thioredoxin